MKRALTAAGLVVLIVSAAAAFTAITREREYRRLIAEADRALAAEDTFAAIEALSGALALKPQSMLAHLKRADAYRRRGELTAALRDLRRAVDLDPSALRALELIGDVQFDLGRYDRAIVRYGEAVQLDDRSPRLLYKLALARYRDGQVAAAIAPLQQALALEERRPELHYLLGLCFRDLGRPADAVRVLSRAVELAPASVASREALAWVLDEIGRPGDAVEQFEALAALEPRRPERQAALGLAYARAGRTDLAVLALGRAIEQFPDHPQLYTALARIWLDLAEAQRDRVALGKALEALKRALLVAPNSSELATLHGRALWLAGDVEEAARLLEEATRWPVDPDSFRLLARVRERLGDRRAARDALVRYLALAGDRLPGGTRGTYARQIGDWSLALGEPGAALTWYDRALEERPGDPHLLAALVEAHRRRGDLDAARRLLADALARSPRDPTLLALRGKLP